MMNNIPKKYQDLLDEFPFLTLIKYGGNEYVGIIQNMDIFTAMRQQKDWIK